MAKTRKGPRTPSKKVQSDKRCPSEVAPTGQPCPAGPEPAKAIPEIELNDWSEFESAVRRKLGAREFVLRNFDLVTFDGAVTGDPVEVDSLEVVRATGTDRRENARMWNEPGFDHEHDRAPSGKQPQEITYGSWMDFRSSPYKASRAQGDNAVVMEAYDITDGLTEHEALILYDPSHLQRVSANEYWFRSTAFDAALLIVRIKP